MSTNGYPDSSRIYTADDQVFEERPPEGSCPQCTNAPEDCACDEVVVVGGEDLARDILALVNPGVRS